MHVCANGSFVFHVICSSLDIKSDAHQDVIFVFILIFFKKQLNDIQIFRLYNI